MDKSETIKQPWPIPNSDFLDARTWNNMVRYLLQLEDRIKCLERDQRDREEARLEGYPGGR